MTLFKLIHILSAMIWVGGMFFAYVVLRPSAVEILHPPERLRLWNRVFGRFFNWVWLAVFLLLVSGFYMIYLLGGIAQVAHHIHLMLGLGISMMLIFIYVYFVCHVRLNLLVIAEDWPKAGELLASIRKLVAINLSIGLLTIAVAVIGRGM